MSARLPIKAWAVVYGGEIFYQTGCIGCENLGRLSIYNTRKNALANKADEEWIVRIEISRPKNSEKAIYKTNQTKRVG